MAIIGGNANPLRQELSSVGKMSRDVGNQLEHHLGKSKFAFHGLHEVIRTIVRDSPGLMTALTLAISPVVGIVSAIGAAAAAFVEKLKEARAEAIEMSNRLLDLDRAFHEGQIKEADKMAEALREQKDARQEIIDRLREELALNRANGDALEKNAEAIAKAEAALSKIPIVPGHANAGGLLAQNEELLKTRKQDLEKAKKELTEAQNPSVWQDLAGRPLINRHGWFPGIANPASLFSNPVNLPGAQSKYDAAAKAVDDQERIVKGLRESLKAHEESVKQSTTASRELEKIKSQEALKNAHTDNRKVGEREGYSSYRPDVNSLQRIGAYASAPSLELTALQVHQRSERHLAGINQRLDKLINRPPGTRF